MDAKEYLIEKLNDSDYAAGIAINSIPVADMLEEYHQAKSKEEAEERYEEALEFLPLGFSKYEEAAFIKGLKAAFGKDEK